MSDAELLAMSDAELLAAIGPGFGTAPALAWNAFAFALGKRLLVAMSKTDGEPHTIDICSRALAMVGAPEALFTAPDAATTLGIVEATLRPMTMFSRSPAAAWFQRVFAWGLRRARRDRKLADTLAAIAAEACELHGSLVERAGGDRAAAIAAERAAQVADARAVLAGEHAALLG